MLNPRLVKVACPQCGAGMRIDVKASVVTCSYCQVSSFVHLPNRPASPPPAGDTQAYRHIHVPQTALRAVGAFAALMIIVPIVVAAGIFVVAAGVIFGVGSRIMGSTRPSPSPVTISTGKAGGTGGKSADPCEKAVACCKAVMRAAATADQRTCEAMRALPDKDCEDQIKTFETSARTLGETCD